MSHLDDATLVAQVQEGNLVAFEGLYERYKTMISRTALGITHDHPAAAIAPLLPSGRGARKEVRTR